MRKVHSIIKPLAGGGLLLLSSITCTTYANTTQASLPIASFIGSYCNITANDLAFGIYNPVSDDDLEAETSLYVKCTPGQHFTVTIDAGTGANATVNDRKMTITTGGSSDTLHYQIYTQPNHNNIWENIEDINAQSSVTRKNFKIYGEINAHQDVAAGDYLDTLVATVTF